MKKTASQKRQELFSDRVRFNWGYHDAAGEVKNGRPRLTQCFGEQTTRIVSREHDAAYYDGYIAGLEDARANQCTECSAPAWKRLTGKIDRCLCAQVNRAHAY